MKSKITFIVLLLFSILSVAISSSNVLAEIEVETYTTSRDFTLSTAHTNVEVCACSLTEDSFQVTNTATWPSIYTVQISGENKNTLTISEQTFELYPGQSKDVKLFINAVCDKKSEDIKILVTSNLGVTKTLDKSILSNRCQNIEMILANYNNNVNPCESRSFEIVVKNIGTFSDTYSLSSNFDEEGRITYSSNSFILNPGEYQKVTAKTNFDCSIFGQKNIIFTAKSQNNKLVADVNAELNINSKYDYDVQIGTDKTKINYNTLYEQVCNRLPSNKIPFLITNKADIENTYTINYDLDKYSKLVEIVGNNVLEISKNAEITLKKGESKLFYIDVDSGNYRFDEKSTKSKINIQSKYGNGEFDKEFELNLNYKSCYEHTVEIIDNINNEKYPLKTCAEYEYKHDIKISNNGQFSEKYDISLENAPSGIKLSENKITINKGESKTVTMLITGPEENIKSEIFVKVVSGAGMTEYDSTWIETYDSKTCHNTEISKETFKINYQDKSISIPVENNGMVDNAYIVSWKGDNIVDKTDLLLQLPKDQKGYVNMQLDFTEKTEGIYTGILSLKDASGTEYTKEISLVLKDKSLVRKSFEYLAFNNICKQATLGQIIIIPLLLIVIIVLYIRSPKYQYNFKNRVKSKIGVIVFLLILFVAALAAVLVYAGMPQTKSQVYNIDTNESKLIYEWLENDKYVLDAGKFFYDPDNSSLKYSISGTKNIKATIKGKTITFYPDKDWSGTEKARITATDNYGGSVTSPEFTLRVLDVPRKSYLELYNIYCWYVNLAIYLIILLLIFIAVFVKQEIRRRK